MAFDRWCGKGREGRFHCPERDCAVRVAGHFRYRFSHERACVDGRFGNGCIGEFVGISIWPQVARKVGLIYFVVYLAIIIHLVDFKAIVGWDYGHALWVVVVDGVSRPRRSAVSDVGNHQAFGWHIAVPALICAVFDYIIFVAVGRVGYFYSFVSSDVLLVEHWQRIERVFSGFFKFNPAHECLFVCRVPDGSVAVVVIRAVVHQRPF